MEELDSERLALCLAGHLDPQIIELLKDQQVTGASFMYLDHATLRLFDFPMGHILQIVKLIDGIKSKSLVLNITGAPSHQDQNAEDELALTKYVKADYLRSLTAFSRQGLISRLKIWTEMQSSGFACSSVPNLNVPPEHLIQSNSEMPRRNSTTDKSASSDVENTLTSSSSDDGDIDSENTSKFAPLLLAPINPPLLLKTKEELNTMSPRLPSFDIESILKKDEKFKHCVPILKDGKLLNEKARKFMIRILGRFLCKEYVSGPALATAAMREGIAKSLVVTYPQYQKSIDVPGQTPWSHIWSSNSGHLVNVIKRIQTGLPDSQRARKSLPPKRKKQKNLKNAAGVFNIKTLAIIMPDRVGRDEIMDGMRKSFEMRCRARNDGASITKLIKDYPHLLSYGGELIAAEFKLMFPDAKDMCPIMLEFIPKVLQKWNNGIETTFCDDTFMAFLFMAYKLPRSIRGAHPIPVEKDVVVVVKPGVDLNDVVQERRDEANGQPVQPYLLAIKGQMTPNILKYFVVLDGNLLELGNPPFIRSFDWLFKCYFVFNVNYPKSWEQLFRFLQTCIYKIYRNDNDDIPPSSLAMYNRLVSL